MMRWKCTTVAWLRQTQCSWKQYKRGNPGTLHEEQSMKAVLDSNFLNQHSGILLIWLVAGNLHENSQPKETSWRQLQWMGSQLDSRAKADVWTRKSNKQNTAETGTRIWNCVVKKALSAFAATKAETKQSLNNHNSTQKAPFFSADTVMHYTQLIWVSRFQLVL